MMKKWIGAAALLLTLLACHTEQPADTAPARSVVTVSFGELPDSVSFEARLIGSTPYDHVGEMFSVTSLQPSFSWSRTLFGMQQFVLAFSTGPSVSFLLFPGDSVHLAMDAAAVMTGDSARFVTFSGSHSDVNRQVDEWIRYIHPKIYRTWNYHLTSKQFMKAFRAALAPLRQCLDVYADRTAMLPEVRDWALRDLTYALASTVERMPDGMSSLYHDKLFAVSEAGNLASQAFLMQMDRYLSSTMASARARLGLDATPAVLARSMVRDVMALPAGPVRDYLLYTFASGVISGGNGEALSQAVPGLEQSIGSPDVRRLLDHARQEYLYGLSDDVKLDRVVWLEGSTPRTVSVDTLFLGFLQKKYPGQALLVDCWTVWCEACAFEMEDAAGLQQQLEQEGLPVTFVNCCVQSGYADWLEQARRSPLKALQCYMDDHAFRKLENKFAPETYPMYLLVAPDGRIISQDVPYPSASGKLLEMIRELF